MSKRLDLNILRKQGLFDEELGRCSCFATGGLKLLGLMVDPGLVIYKLSRSPISASLPLRDHSRLNISVTCIFAHLLLNDPMLVRLSSLVG